MDQQIVTPQQQLSKVVIRVWIIGEIIANFIGLLVLAALFFGLQIFMAGMGWVDHFGCHYSFCRWNNMVCVFRAIFEV